MNYRVILGALLFCLVVATITNAQNKRTGSAAATELLVPIGARDFAMGGSTSAISEGVESVHWNPAGLGRLGYSAEAMFSTMSYIADIRVNYGAAAASFGDFGVIGISFKGLDFGDIPLTTNEDPEALSGQQYSPTYVTSSLTYGRALSDAIAVGATAKLISESIDRVSATGFAFDVGIQYRNLVGINGFDLGVAVKNIGPSMQFEGSGLLRTATANTGDRPAQPYSSVAAEFELPSTVEIGLAYRGSASDNNLMYSVNGSFTNNNLFLDEYRVGGEIGGRMDMISLFGRVGMGFVPQAEDDGNIFGTAFGFGFTYHGSGIAVTVDYANRVTDFFDNSNVISIKLGF